MSHFDDGSHVLAFMLDLRFRIRLRDPTYCFEACDSPVRKTHAKAAEMSLATSPLWA